MLLFLASVLSWLLLFAFAFQTLIMENGMIELFLFHTSLTLVSTKHLFRFHEFYFSDHFLEVYIFLSDKIKNSCISN